MGSCIKSITPKSLVTVEKKLLNGPNRSDDVNGDVSNHQQIFNKKKCSAHLPSFLGKSKLGKARKIPLRHSS
jgi:hypothetical protein